MGMTWLAFCVLTISTFAADEKPKPVVLVSPAKLAALFDVLTYPARVVPKISANVLAESDGVVSKIAAPLGQKVGHHQKLMVITHTDPVYQYAPVIVTAPVAGIVSQVEVTEGSLVARGQRLATVTDPSQVRVLVEIAAADLPSIHAGLVGELNLPGTDEKVDVRVRGVSPFVDPATGTATCELDTTKVAGKVRLISPGLLGHVHFKVNEHQGFSLPDYAIYYKGNDTFLRVVEAGKSHLRPVTLGRKQRGTVEITKGLVAGASVIERASGFIAEGESVTAQETKL